MRYLIILSFFLISCIEEIVIDNNLLMLDLRYDGDRLTFKQISTPQILLDVTSNNQSFDVVGVSDTNDVRVTLIYDCDTGKEENLNKEVLVNFYEDRRTVLEITSVLICNPTIKVLYE
tara:strand:- start:128 stop:481 length:354 start_codon:yes stop_codon:yes gene_type:complete